ncbi:unnamed protein product, partial [Brenthis ino]
MSFENAAHRSTRRKHAWHVSTLGARRSALGSHLYECCMRVRTSVRQVLALLVRTGGWCSPDVIKARLVKCLALEDAYCAFASGVVPEDAYYVCASGVVPEDAYYVCASGVVPEDAYYVCASGIIPEVVFSEHASGCNDENPDGVLYDYADPTNVLSTNGTETNKNGGQTVATSTAVSDEEVPGAAEDGARSGVAV